MILPDKRPVQSDFANLTDYSLECPKGARKFFAFIHFTDESTCLWSNIFTFNRSCALMLTMSATASNMFRASISTSRIIERPSLPLREAPRNRGFCRICRFIIQPSYHLFIAFIFSDPPGWWRPSAIQTSLCTPLAAYILPSPSIVGRGSASLHFD